MNKILFASAFGAPQKTAFLDRDGVINTDHGYVYRKEEFDFVPGVLEACRELKDKGYALAIITNQSGIGRGKYSSEDFRRLCFWLEGKFEQAGAPLAGIYFCPHHPERALAPYLKKCGCRKPEPGMILEAAKDLNLNLAESIFFGDKDSDMRAALKAGIKNRILLKSNGTEEYDCRDNASAAFPSLQEAVKNL